MELIEGFLCSLIQKSRWSFNLRLTKRLLSSTLMLPTAVFEKIEPAFDQFQFVIDRCERLAFALVTTGASLSFEYKSEGEEHTEDLFRA
jgi:hypothetical protein